MARETDNNGSARPEDENLAVKLPGSLLTAAAFEKFKEGYPNMELAVQDDGDQQILSVAGSPKDIESLRLDIEFFSRNPQIAAENICSQVGNYIPKNKSQAELKMWAQKLIRLDAATVAAGLFMFGESGVGKSHMAVGVAKELMRQGFSVNFLEADDYPRIRKGHDQLAPNQVWIIDDLNSPYGSGIDFFKRAVLNAHNYGGRIFVTSNTDYHDLMEHAFVTDKAEKPRYMDRTKGMFRIIEVTGESQRQENPWHRSE